MPNSQSRLEASDNEGAPVKICRADGSEVPVRLRLLSYDGCELEADNIFTSGEQVRIHVYRMGWIRARITSCGSKVVEAEFIQDCPV